MKIGLSYFRISYTIKADEGESNIKLYFFLWPKCIFNGFIHLQEIYSHKLNFHQKMVSFTFLDFLTEIFNYLEVLFAAR